MLAPTELPSAILPNVVPRATNKLITYSRVAAIVNLGTSWLRYSLVFLLLLFGIYKFFQFEAEGVAPFIASSPFMAWTINVFGTRGISFILGSFEITAAVLIASRRFAPKLSMAGSLLAALMFFTTLSFLFSTPGALVPGDTAGNFLIKDIVLFGAALHTAGEAGRASLDASHSLTR
ncbi:MAG: DUF417 family protein [Clostridia bacterium]|nr:DUF417 family protein [Deltaproteobacteria bacterium]